LNFDISTTKWDIKHEGQTLIGAALKNKRHETFAGMEASFHAVLTSVLDGYAGYGVTG